MRRVRKLRVGQLLPGKGPEWMGIHHHEQSIGLHSKWGFYLSFSRGVGAQIINCVFCKYKVNFCVQVKKKPCMVYTIIKHLISWKLSHGSKNYKYQENSHLCRFLNLPVHSHPMPKRTQLSVSRQNNTGP